MNESYSREAGIKKNYMMSPTFSHIDQVGNSVLAEHGLGGWLHVFIEAPPAHVWFAGYEHIDRVLYQQGHLNAVYSAVKPHLSLLLDGSKSVWIHGSNPCYTHGDAGSGSLSTVMLWRGDDASSIYKDAGVRGPDAVRFDIDC